MGWDNDKPNRSTRPTLTTMSYRGRMGGWAGTITNQTRAHARHLQLRVLGEGWEDGLGQKNKPNKSTQPTHTTMSYRGRMGGWAGTKKQTKQEHTPDAYNYELQGKDGRMGWDKKTKQEHTPDTYNYELQGKDGRMGWDNDKPNKSTQPTLTTMS